MSYYVVKPKDIIGNHPGGTIRVLCRFGTDGLYFSDEAWKALLPNQDTALRRNARLGEINVKREKGALPWEEIPDEAMVAVPLTEERLLRHYPHAVDQPQRCMNPARCDLQTAHRGDDYDAEQCGFSDDRCVYTPVTRLVFRPKAQLAGPPTVPAGPWLRSTKSRPPRRPLPGDTSPAGRQDAVPPVDDPPEEVPPPAATPPGVTRGSQGRFTKVSEAG